MMVPIAVRTNLSITEIGKTAWKKRGFGVNSRINIRLPNIWPATVEEKLVKLTPLINCILSSLLKLSTSLSLKIRMTPRAPKCRTGYRGIALPVGVKYQPIMSNPRIRNIEPMSIFNDQSLQSLLGKQNYYSNRGSMAAIICDNSLNGPICTCCKVLLRSIK